MWTSRQASLTPMPTCGRARCSEFRTGPDGENQRSLQILASNAEPTPETPLRIVKEPTTAPSSNHCGGSLNNTRASQSAPTSRPLTAPRAPDQGNDISSSPRRPSAIPATAENIAPQRKPAYNGPPIHSGSNSPTISHPASEPTGTHAAAQARPITAARPIRLSDFFISGVLWQVVYITKYFI